MRNCGSDLMVFILISVGLNELFYPALINKAGRQFLEIKKLNLLPTGSYAPVGSFRPGATQTDGVEIIKRRRCLGSGAFVTSAPASPSRADERNVGEEIERRRCVVALFTGGRRRAGGTNRRPHSKSEKSPLLRYRQAYFPGGVDFA